VSHTAVLDCYQSLILRWSGRRSDRVLYLLWSAAALTEEWVARGASLAYVDRA